MPTETRLTQVSIGARQVRLPKGDDSGQPMHDPETGMPMMIDVIELAFINPMTGDATVIPLGPEGIENVIKALRPSSVVVPPPGLQL